MVSGALVLLLGPKLLALLPVWLAGVLLYTVRGRVELSRRLAALGWGLSFALLVGYGLSDAEEWLRVAGLQLWPLAGVPAGSASRYLADYVVTVLVFANFYCAEQLSWRSLHPLRWIIRKGARYTFALYLTHMLPIRFAEAVFAPDGYSLVERLGVFAAIALFAIGFGELGEWLRVRMQRMAVPGPARAINKPVMSPPA